MVSIEKTLRKSIFCLGAVIALAFASAPLSSFADANTTANSTVTVMVNPTLTLELIIADDVADPGAENAMLIELSPNLAETGRFTARVSTNLNYTLQLNGLDGTDLINEVSNTIIPSASTSGCSVVAGTTCWGVVAWPSTELEPTSPTYQPIPSTPTTFYSGTGPVYKEDTIFEVGISAGSNLISGNYKGKLVVTASNS